MRRAARTEREAVSRIDRDLDYGIQLENVAIFTMLFLIPMPNPSPVLTDKVKAPFLSQVSEIANQVCDGMLVTGAAAPLINRDGFGGPGNVVGFIGHAFSSTICLRLGHVRPAVRPLATATYSITSLE
jgi:hypothetical protein